MQKSTKLSLKHIACTSIKIVKPKMKRTAIILFVLCGIVASVFSSGEVLLGNYYKEVVNCYCGAS